MASSQPYPAGSVEQPARQPRNGLGTAGFVLGLLGLIFSPLPLVGIVAWPLVILGLILSLLGFFRAKRGEATNKGLALAGVVCSVIGLVICILWAAAFGKAVNDVNEEAGREVTVRYEVTGDAPNASISYTTFGDGNMSTNEENVSELPWSKELTTKGLMKGGSLTVMTGAEGGSVTCTVTVDGKDAKSSTAQGEFATASCDGFGS
ncbi:MmpS family transport accessory protein [Prauserella rugosa]|uniref:MmpS family membrane protein n=1 Tax=Prauserella rugosa TaxID=43354 RepID=A0A660CEP4_9PSEU|nr:MmpS family transport accessory protein [Prauserella rugosa]KMS92201.1 hypothetical protein ACZ91_05555 [Streptomyces regensis]TWH20357.1 MmpS family membrane protein [Prauserella rugosa]